MNLATMLPAIAYLPSTLGLSAAPGELGEMLRIVLCLSLIVGGGSIAVACVDGFVAADRTPERAPESAPSSPAAAPRSAIIRSLTLKGK